MKKLNKILSVGLSLALCAGMVAPAFAASFSQLQDAIDGKVGADLEGSDHKGYAWNEETKQYGIEAWTEGEVRNVKLKEDVIYDANPESSPDLNTITIKDKKVDLDLNGNTIDGGYREEVKDDEGHVTQEAAAGSGNRVITMNGAEVTIRNGDITGGKDKTGGGIQSQNSNLTLENVEIHDNYADHSGGGIRFNVDGRAKPRENYFTMNGGSIHHNTVTGEDSNLGNGGGIYIQGLSNSLNKGRAVAVMTDVDVHHNDGFGYAGGIRTWGTDITLNNVNVRDNFVTEDEEDGAGGILVSSGSKLIMNGGSITGNKCNKGVGGGMWITGLNDIAELNGVRITGNSTGGEGGGIYLSARNSKLTLGKGNEIHSNTSSAGPSDIYAEAGVIIRGLDQTPKTPEGQQFNGWYTENGEGVQYNGDDGRTTEDMDLVGSLSDAPTPTTPTGPNVFEGYDFGTTTIDDPAVPLASGPVTRAEFIDYLWRHENEPASAGVCTFTDVEEDHEYFAALCWADENGVAEAYFGAEGHEDGTFEPDELVTVAAVREFLDNFADVFGTNVVAADDLTTLTGEEDEAVLNCDEVLAEFFGEEYTPAEVEDDIAA